MTLPTTCPTCGGPRPVRAPDPCSDEFHHGSRIDPSDSLSARIGRDGPAAHAAADIRDRIAAKRAREALAPGRILCPRCEGQKYDRGSCQLCDNRGWLDDA